MTLQFKRKTVCLKRLMLTSMLLIVASAGAAAQTNTFPSSGNTGIGTTSPDRPLHVKDSGSYVGKFESTSANSYVEVKDTNANSVNRGIFGNYLGDFFFQKEGSTYGFDFITGATSKMKILNNGNVGIGTLNPANKLEVGLGAANNSVVASFGNNTRTDAIRLTIDSSSNGLIQLRQGSSATVGALVSSAGDSYFNGGNVGIGNVNPSYKLDVNGEINATGIRINGTPISGGGSSQWNGPDANGNISNANSGKVGIGVSSSLGTSLTVGRDLELDSWSDGTTRWALVQGYDRSTATIRPIFFEGSKFHFSGGNVGIGTTSPGYLLDARGTIAVTDSNANTIARMRGIGASGSQRGALELHDTNVVKTAFYSDGNDSFINGGGRFGIGIALPTQRLHVAGNINVTATATEAGDITIAGTINAKYQDVAEWVPSSERLTAGTVVVLDSTRSNQVVSSSQSYDTRVAGVISAQPGIALGEKGAGKVLVATTGRVRVKVDVSRGAIQIGDLLVTSDVPGVAMKSEPVEFAGRKMHMPGTIIGKALEPMAKGSGEILVLLSLQ